MKINNKLINLFLNIYRNKDMNTSQKILDKINKEYYDRRK